MPAPHPISPLLMLKIAGAHAVREWNRIERKVANATEDQIDAWQDSLSKRLFDCGFGGKRDEFLRLLSNAYHRFPQYREAICAEVGVRGYADYARIRSIATLVLTIIVVIVSVATLVATYCRK